MSEEHEAAPPEDEKVSRRQPSDGHLKDDEPDDESGSPSDGDEAPSGVKGR